MASPQGFEPWFLFLTSEPVSLCLLFTLEMGQKTLTYKAGRAVTFAVTCLMAYLRRIPKSPYWIAGFTLPDGRRTQRSTKTRHRKEAMRLAEQWEDASRRRITEAQARRVLSDIHEQIHGERLASPSVVEYVAQWLGRKQGETSSSTLATYRHAVDEFTAFLADSAAQPIHYVTPTQVAAWRDAAATKARSRTANNKLKIVRVLFQSAWRDGLLAQNPAAKVQTLKTNASERQPFTEDELRRLLAVASDEWRGLILFGLYTGQRLGDIATLRWTQIDLTRGEVTFQTRKTGRRVLLPIAAPLLSYLLTFPAADEPEAPVFPDAFAIVEEQGRVGTLSNRFAGLLTAAGLAPKRTHQKTKNGRSTERDTSRLSFHCLRHTATSLLKNAGVSESVTRDIIGHESAEISRLYTHIDESTKRAALATMPDLTKKLES
jgi:integrase